MANEEHLAILRQGVVAWNKWREEHVEIRPNFHKADLSGANLNKADLRDADFSKADLKGANLNAADLSKANLHGADLSETNLRVAKLVGANLSQVNLSDACVNGAGLYGADLSGANLYGADLGEANLLVANLSEADLSEVNLGEAYIGGTVFGDLDLSATVGLDSVQHNGPSTIGIDTIYKSQGKIPEVFLRGCGVPDEMITFTHSLVAANAIQFYSCFISYSTKDEDFAKRLHADLQANNVRCWFAPEDVQGGKKLHEQIDEAIRYHDKLLLILSENSMGSEWVKTEIRRARIQEVKAGRRKLFPISLAPFDAIRAWEAFDADIGKDMAVEVREYFVPDFSCWKDHDAYRKAFDRLLRDLKAEPNT
jgi:hypothetical protein